MNKTVIQIKDINDPYEPGYTIAICDSVEAAKELFPDELYEDAGMDGSSYKSKNLHTGQIFTDTWPRTPYIKETILNQKI